MAISDAQPTTIEREVYEEVQKVLLKSESILEELQCYKGAGKEIREAISTPTEECQLRAWQAVLPLVEKLKRFYLFSKELGKKNANMYCHFCTVTGVSKHECRYIFLVYSIRYIHVFIWEDIYPEVCFSS